VMGRRVPPTLVAGMHNLQSLGGLLAVGRSECLDFCDIRFLSIIPTLTIDSSLVHN